ncbi:uncharacterized protein LOC111083562 [Limulus polyphemus]|uniref:Uncharacterized protein LOC111083562 n=1 Tax=Limulus polyphemus TaxID=6850 RepID=A0ABM1RWW2_LIMPO|nr:uncharacterized protein LOC111083562 [Limulus polyphemus]
MSLSSSSVSSSSSSLPRRHDRISSFSLNDLSSIGYQHKKVAERCIKKFISFTDLRTLKSGERLDELSAVDRYEYRNFNLNLPSHRSALLLQNALDVQHLYSMPKDDIIRMWRITERQMFNTLREALKQKAELEEKLSFLQKALLRPP